VVVVVEASPLEVEISVIYFNLIFVKSLLILSILEDFMGSGGQHSHESKEVDTEKFYKVLEVSKTASADEIKKAFRKKALKEHPDKGGDPEKVSYSY
jgi:preprotein translocase subunit Sec63